MIILGIIALVLGWLLGISVLWIIGIVLVVLGLVLLVLGMTGSYLVGGRRYWY